MISDHERYYPSLRAIECYRDAPIEMTIVPGEEVHMPPVRGKRNAVHIVNFGGEFSVNALVEGTATNEAGSDLSVRAIRISGLGRDQQCACDDDCEYCGDDTGSLSCSCHFLSSF